MKVNEIQDGKQVTLSKAFDTRSKMLNFIYGLMFLGAIFGIVSSVGVPESWQSGIFLIIIVVVLGIACYRFMNNAMRKESMIIIPEKIKLIKKSLYTTEKKEFDPKAISGFRHLGKPELSKHPLAGESFDYLGFQTEQQVINEMHGDNRMAFEYEGKTINFGENIYSWEFDELTALLTKITGQFFGAAPGIESALREDGPPDTEEGNS